MNLLQEVTFVLVALTTLVGVRCSHFRGGYITWKPAGINQIEIAYRVAFRKSAGGHFCDASTISNGSLSNGEGHLECLSGCSGTITAMSYYCTDFSENENWSTGTRTVTYNTSASQSNIYQFGYSSCCWIDLVQGGGSWLLRSTADLSIRGDKGKINSSPVTGMQPIVRFSHGCDYSLRIPVADDDGDTVRCRWARNTGYDECADVCNSFNGSYLDENACTLKYNATGPTGWYAVALQIEDFRSSTDTVPLSSISLQFMVLVSKTNTSCSSKPVLPPNIITDGSTHYLLVNESFNVTIVARSGTDSLLVTEINTLSPQGMIKSELYPYGNTGREWSVYVTWIPTVTQYGSYVFCYTAIDNIGQSSDQVCATLVVQGHMHIDITTTKATGNNGVNVVMLNPKCTDFIHPSVVTTICAGASSIQLYYYTTSCTTHFLECDSTGHGYIVACPAGLVWCQSELTCDYDRSCPKKYFG